MSMIDWTHGFARRAAWRVAALAVLAFLPLLAAGAGSSVPPAVISSVATVTATGLGVYQTDVAFDACGNIYSMQSGGIYNPITAVNGGQISETPAGGGAATVVLAGSGPNWQSNSLTIDQSKSNLYFTEGPGGTSVYKIPLVNCVPQVAQKSAIGIGNLGPISYYWNGSAVTTDTAGDVFIATNESCCGAAVNELLEESVAGAGTVLLNNLANAITSMAVDSSNNIYYVASGGVYELAFSAGAYSSKPVTYGSGYKTAVGVSIDSAGNLYVADSGDSKVSGSSAIYEIPYEANNGLNPADQYMVAAGVAITARVAIDASGNLYYTNLNSANAGASITELTRSFANTGPVAVGSSGSTALNVVFNAAVTPAAIDFLTNNGVFSSGTGTTCATGTAYTTGQTCVVSAAFAPASPGAAYGALVLADAAGAALATANLNGWGLGAGLTVDPGAVTPIGSGMKTPTSVAMDVVGDLFIADSGNNKVWEIPGGGTKAVAIGIGLNGPAGVAADSAGNVYIADSGNNRIVEVPFLNGALNSSAQAVLVDGSASIAGSTLSSPQGVSVDAQGNLYLADTGNSRVVFLPQSGNWNVEGAFTLGSGFSNPLATTVSSSGLIYVADSGNGKVYSIPYPAAAAAKTLVATGFNDPSALATDAAGDLFVVDKGNSQVLRIPNVSGSLAAGSSLNVSLGIADPYGLAIDPAGNLYVSDDVNSAAYVVARTNSTQSFGKWNPGTTSDPASFQVESSGNQALTFNTPYYSAAGSTAAFKLSSSEADACANGGSVAVGTSCTLQATFDPPALAAYSETLALSSNATNAAVLEVVFTGIGATTSATATTLTITSPGGAPYYGEAIALKVSVTASIGTPTGLVALLVDGLQAATSALDGGTAKFTLAKGLTGGSHTLQAAYQGAESGFVVYSRSESPIDTIDVTRVGTTTGIAFTTAYINPPSQPAKSALTLIAMVTPINGGIPTGTVTFTIADSGGTTVTETAPLAAASGGVFQATYSYTPAAPASNVAYDVVSIGASYGGDGNFKGSSSATQSLDVSPASGSVLVSTSGTSLNSTGSLTLTATSYGGWNGVVGFQCQASSLPANAICVFSPGQMVVQPSTSYAPYPPAKTKLSVVVNNPPNSPAQGAMLWWLGGLTGLSLFWVRRRAGIAAWGAICGLAGAILLAASAAGLAACNSGVSFRTPAGSSTIVVVANADPYTSGSTSTTQSCGTIPGSNPPAGSPALAPCSQQTFQLTLKVP